MIHMFRARAALERGMRLGWHTGARLYAAPSGETAADIALGAARPGVPVATTTIGPSLLAALYEDLGRAGGGDSTGRAGAP